MVRVQSSWKRTQLIIQRQSTLMFNITFVRDMIDEKKVSLMKVDTLKNVVDSLKKYVITEKFSWCRGSMGITTLDC